MQCVQTWSQAARLSSKQQAKAFLPSSQAAGCKLIARALPPRQQAAPEAHQQGCSRRDAVGMLLAAPMLTWLANGVSAQPARAAAATTANSNAALEEYMQMEDRGKLSDSKTLDNFRQKYGIRRGIDGRVSLRSKSGQWYTIRLDMEVPGALLLRDPKGNVYAIETQDLPQVDLSDDYVLLMMFADGAWEEQMSPVEFVDESSAGGETTQLNMSEKEFREFIGLLKDFEDGGDQ